MKYYKHYNKIWAKIFVVVVALCGFILCSKTIYAADTTWQDDYSYTLDEDNHFIKLEKYNGSATTLTVPAKATKDGKEYTTYIETYSWTKPWSDDTNLIELSFASGIQLGSRLDNLFSDCSNLKSLDVSHFNTSNVSSMQGIFHGCSNLTTLDLSNFDTSNVELLNNMFSGCSSLTSLDVSSLNTTKAYNMAGMFADCTELTTLDLSNFDTSNVEILNNMFSNCSNLKSLDLRKFNTGKVSSMSSMFSNCSKLESLDLSNFDTGNVTNMERMFVNCVNLQTLDVSHFNTINVTNMVEMFECCSKLTTLDVSHFDTSNVTNMQHMFSRCSKLTTLDVSGFDTSNVTNMAGMFYECFAIKSLDVSSFDTSRVTTMLGMFSWCSRLASMDLSNFNTSNVTDLGNLFLDCSNLTSVNISNFNTANVTNMAGMFRECTNLRSLNLSSFDTSKVEDMGFIFCDCSNLRTLNLSSFDTKNVTRMYSMFSGCSELTELDLHSFTCKNVTDLVNMFDGCSSLKTINTPCDLTEDVALPGTFHDEDNNNYDWLPKNTSVSILLTKNPPTIYESDVEIKVLDQIYTGNALEPDITIKLGEETIDAENYTLSYSDNINVGTAKVIIVFKNNYTGTVTKEFKIKPQDVNPSSAKISVPDQTYTGGTIEPSVTVKLGEETIAPKYYTVSFNDNIDAGTATVTVVFKGNYSGTVTGSFEINPLEVDASSVDITVSDQTYTGTELEPAVEVKLEGETLSSEKYTLSYSNNINVGTATVTVTFKGNYAGTATKTFNINEKTVDASSAEITVSDQTYTGKVLEPAVTVKLGGQTISQDKYTVSYNDNINAGTAKVTVTFKGNYTGTASKTFKINPIQVSSSAVKITVSDQTYKGQPLEPPVNVKVGGETITAENYRVSYDNNFNVGTAKVTVTFKGNYRGTAAATFKIKEGNNGGNPSDGTTAEKKPAAGKVKSIKLKANKTKVKKGKKVTVKATVVYSGARNGGSKAVTWKVKGAGKISKKKATSCTITAKKKKGTITVTAISKQDKKVKKTIKIKVQ